MPREPIEVGGVALRQLFQPPADIVAEVDDVWVEGRRLPAGSYRRGLTAVDVEAPGRVLRENC
jgi:hypothetical protein